jgi:hypothetical protein
MRKWGLHVIVTPVRSASTHCVRRAQRRRRSAATGSRELSRTSFPVRVLLPTVNGPASASFVHDDDGNRVKSVLGGVTTYYVGNHFEWTGSTSQMIKYYYAGGQRVAMRKGNPGTVSFLLGDHLGSTSITANSSGGKVAESRPPVL